MEADRTVVKRIISRGIEAQSWAKVHQVVKMAATNLGKVPTGVLLADHIVADSLTVVTSCGEVTRRIHEDGPLAGATIEIRKEGNGFLVGIWKSETTDYEAFLAESMGAERMIIGTNIEVIYEPMGMARFEIDMDRFIRDHLDGSLPTGGVSGNNVVTSFINGARNGQSNTFTVGPVDGLSVTLSLCGVGECYPPRCKGTGTWRISNESRLSVPLVIDTNATRQEGFPPVKVKPTMLIRIRDMGTIPPFDFVPMGGERKKRAIAIMDAVADTFGLPAERVRTIQV